MNSIIPQFTRLPSSVLSLILTAEQFYRLAEMTAAAEGLANPRTVVLKHLDDFMCFIAIHKPEDRRIGNRAACWQRR